MAWLLGSSNCRDAHLYDTTCAHVCPPPHTHTYTPCVSGTVQLSAVSVRCRQSRAWAWCVLHVGVCGGVSGVVVQRVWAERAALEVGDGVRHTCRVDAGSERNARPDYDASVVPCTAQSPTAPHRSLTRRERGHRQPTAAFGAAHSHPPHARVCVRTTTSRSSRVVVRVEHARARLHV